MIFSQSKLSHVSNSVCTLHAAQKDRSRIHERTVSSRFQCIILRVLILEVSAYNVYIMYNPVSKTLLLKGGGGGVKISLYIELTVLSKEENS
jgi:hypothetical protein